ncbi:hypothetical protein AAF712_004674 [Marasmius tenuissimus]|uniref:Glucose-methanol-choline oxidoreductase N-terminal domain-containing protein n=1 Tax=Marasmius tenuissimus TaxID=585030 RepID=A0ABR3A4G7_9AGAR
MFFKQASTTVSLLTAAIALASSVADEYDYVIVGGGTAGLTAAVRLTEDSNIKVAVIEAGGTGIGNPNITDLHDTTLPLRTQLDWILPTVPQTSAADRVITQAQGKALGGSSAINGAVYLRPDKREFAALQAVGAKGWTWDKFLDYFKRSEIFSVGGDTFGLEPNTSAHGTSGPIHVSHQHNISKFFAEYAIPTIQNVNQPLNADNSDGHTLGATPQQVSAFDGTYNRSYAANVYYFPNTNRANLKVFTDSLVSKILWGEDEDGLAIATGVEYITADGSASLVCGKMFRLATLTKYVHPFPPQIAKNVIVSAGALNTPRVLELSGIGNTSYLEKLGIEAKIDNVGVGENLQNQLGVDVLFKLKEGVVKGLEFQSPIIDLVSAQQVLSEEDQTRSAEILSTSNRFISPAQLEAMKQLIAEGVPQTEINWFLRESPDGTLSLRFYTTALHTFSRGSSHASSSDPQAKPTVNPD